MIETLTVVLLLLLLIIAITIARTTSLFAAVMMTGIFSLLSAGLYTLMDAVDVAFTEAAVGAGVSTVLMLLVLNLTTDKESSAIQPRIFPLVVALLVGGALIYATQDMPNFGDPNAPIHRSATADHYINKSYDDSHIPNIVTTVLASYRSFDTLGETTVVYTAALAVMMLLGRRKEDRKPEVVNKVKSDAILIVGAKMVIPYILLFALYVQFHGDFGPGGGFQAGVMFAAAYILHALVNSIGQTKKAARLTWIERLIPGGVLLYALVGVVCMFLGGNFLDYNALDPAHPAHGQHIGILLVELGVGITVFSAILMMFFTFALRGRP